MKIVWTSRGAASAAARMAYRILAAFVLAGACATAAAAGNPWFGDHTLGGGPDGCWKPYTGASPSEVIRGWEQCLIDQANATAAPGTFYTLTLTNCQATPATPSNYGSGSCLATWYYHAQDGSSYPSSSGGQSASQCPSNTEFIATPGNPRCSQAGDIFHKPICDKCQVGDPIFPLTGARSQDEDLGIALAGQRLRISYDTALNLPNGADGLNLTLTTLPSFGSLWTSSFHKAVVLQSPTGYPLGNHGSAFLLRGKSVATMAADNATTCANGGDGSGSGNTNALIPTVDANLKLTLASNQASSTSTLVDGGGLIEEAYGGNESAWGGDGGITKAYPAAGGSLTYNYSTSVIPDVAPQKGLLISIVDQSGRSVQFAYEQPDAQFPPRIRQITAPDGALTQVSYDAFGNLQTLTWPDNGVRTFRYERADLPWALTGITDESNQIYSIYDYDATGRSVLTRLGLQANADVYTVSYDSPPRWEVTKTFTSNLVCRDHHWIAPSGTVVKNGAVNRSFGATTANGMTFLSSQSSPAGSGSAASSSANAYDGKGNVLSRDDFDGNRTCLAYDTSRNLEIFRVEGLPATKACPADLSSYVPSPVDAAHPERKTSTLWHPDWALKVREAAPKKITTWVYNGQADPIAGGTASCAPAGAVLPDGKPIAVVCMRYEQSTDDASGARNFAPTTIVGTRAWRYAYNQDGQVLSETAPKLSSTDTLSHTTTYTYYTDTSFPDGVTGHTVGDLQQVQDPLGNLTQFTLYDKAGRLLSSKDPNNTVTTRTWWPRGWIHTVTVKPKGSGDAALTTTYDYWPTGLLHVVTQPDGSTLTYAYDDAHRLTDVTDSAGNTVHYVLDNQGNRTSETVQDATGRLASAIARAYDNLNRLQTVTGAAQ
jgi:YD repeat-containing protein